MANWWPWKASKLLLLCVFVFSMHNLHVSRSTTINVDFDVFLCPRWKEFRTNVSHAQWTYQFPRHSYKNLNKTYKVEVSVGQWYIFFAYPMASNSLKINVTGKWKLKLREIRGENYYWKPFFNHSMSFPFNKFQMASTENGLNENTPSWEFSVCLSLSLPLSWLLRLCCALSGTQKSCSVFFTSNFPLVSNGSLFNVLNYIIRMLCMIGIRNSNRTTIASRYTSSCNRSKFRK